MLPQVLLGETSISRLIIGGNPFSGNSHMSSVLDDEMEDYYTTENIKNTLKRCMECGINTAQMRGDKHIFRILRELKNEGVKMNWIAQTASEVSSFEGNIKQIMKYDPVGIYHHGTITDLLFKENNINEITRRLGIMRSTGKPVGLCTHMPEIIEYSEEHKWDVDFYMACVYNISKIDRNSSMVTGVSNQDEPFDDEDRAIMYDVIRKTEKTCLAFKILGASRRCQSPETVRDAFREAYENIKPIDAVVVGIFQKNGDQVQQNCSYVKEILQP